MRAYETLYYRFLGLLHLTVAVSAFVAGTSLVVWQHRLQADSPLSSMLAGALLYGAVGLSNLFDSYVAARVEEGVELVSLVAGFSIVLWLRAEGALVQDLPWLQPASVAVGVFLVLSSGWLWRARHPRPSDFGHPSHRPDGF